MLLITLHYAHSIGRTGAERQRAERIAAAAQRECDSLLPRWKVPCAPRTGARAKVYHPMTRSFTFPASYAAKSAAIITRTVLLNSHCHRTLNHNEGNTTKIKKECDAFVSCEFFSMPASHAGAALTALGVAKLLRFVQWSAPLNVQGISLNEPCDAGGYLKREITSAGLTRPTFKPMCREK